MKKIFICLCMALTCGLIHSQALQVTGKVTDATDGSPLLGVTVSIKGTTQGAITNPDGVYSIQVPSPDVVLVFSFVGMITREIPVEGQNRIDVILSPELVGLDEIVVVGYGSQSKKLLTGSVGSINNNELERVPISSVDQALQGKLAGVRVMSNSGTPGGGISVRIRGSSSISAGNQPLYVVDGIPISNGDYSQQGFGGQTISAVNDINSSDIESIQILKDASYASIYGARAANGVVLITTKKGQKGKVKVDFNVYSGTQQMAKKLDLLEAHDYMVLVNEAIYNSYGIPDYVGDPDNPPYNTDWQDEVTRVAPISEYQLAFNGGNDNISYYISGTYFDQEGVVIGSDFKRYSGRVNLEAKASEKLKLGTNLSFARSDIHRINGDNNIYAPLANAFANPPIEPVYNPDGTYYNTYYANPVAMGKEPMNKVMSFRNLLSFYAEYKIFPDLAFKSTLNADIMNLREDSFLPTDVGIAVGSNGSGTSGNSNIYKMVSENTLTWDKTIADRHTVTVLGGFSYEVNNEYYTLVNGIQFPSNSFKYLSAAAEVNGGSSYPTKNILASWFGRLNYDFDKKYILQTILRADGSSRFGDNNKIAFFPSFSAAWRISQEEFMLNQNVVSDLKLRVSYGTTGNQEIGNFASRSLWGAGNNYWNMAGIAPIQLENRKLGWEKTSTMEAGLDVSLLQNRIGMGITVYQKNTTDLILIRPVPSYTGFSGIPENVGDIENKGVELSFNTVNLKIPDGLQWTSDFNISFNRNTVVKLYRGEPIDAGFANRFEENHPFAAFYGYDFGGVNPDDGTIIYRDHDGIAGITDDDRIFIGDPNPDFEGGFTNNLSWKGLDLNIFLQFVQGNDIFNATRIYSEGFYLDNMTSRMMDRWQQPGDITDVPRASYADPEYGYTSSRFVEDGSFLRLKTITLGYSLPENILGKIHLRSLRIYATGQNLKTWSKYSGIDPEVNYDGTSNTSLGTDFYTYPLASSVIFGINLGL